MEANRTRRLARVTLNETSIGRGTPDQEHEREIAIYDLTESNDFAVPGDESGPYTLDISLQEARLSLAIAREDGTPVVTHLLSLSPFRSIFKDYFLVCESYYAAIRTASPAQIEAIDTGRRNLHNEGAVLLKARLENKIDCDFDTARRLFTLITALHWRG
ncbi:MAG: UPF0262 family protein [Hyphomicrobiales bacterium]|nr:UPF0262 family protein [Hyphomicrobiales bacterium]